MGLTAVFDAQHGGVATGWSPVSWGLIDELFVNLTMPPGIRRMTERRPLAAWQQLGVRRTSGADLPQVDIFGSLVEIYGRTFLVYDNYDALMRYNCVHRYALSVALFAERLR